MKIAGIAFLLLLAFSLPVSSQSLGNVAKKERERREKNKEAGVSAREITEEEVFSDKAGVPVPDTESAETAEASEARGDESVIPGVKAVPPDADPDKESRERRRREAEWRSRAATARARIAVGRERLQFLEQLWLGPYDTSYVDEKGRTIFRNVQHLMQVTQQARDELAAAEKAWKQMQEDARHAGIPPGWLR
jgi:hypothetical protein